MKRQGTQAPATITVHVPLQFSVRGGRKQIIGAATSAPRSQIDAVVKALARAHRWRKLIESGEFASITELARAEKVNQSYGLPYAAADIVESPDRQRHPGWEPRSAADPERVNEARSDHLG